MHCLYTAGSDCSAAFYVLTSLHAAELPHFAISPKPQTGLYLYLKHIYSIDTFPPNASKVLTIFSASSLGTPSFSTLGALSANFLLSTRLSPSIDLTSLMIFGFDVGSKDSSFRVKSVFAAGAGAASSSSTGGGAAAAAPPELEAEKDMSGILRRDWRRRGVWVSRWW
jgi:hypothetical protein